MAVAYRETLVDNDTWTKRSSIFTRSSSVRRWIMIRELKEVVYSPDPVVLGCDQVLVCKQEWLARRCIWNYGRKLLYCILDHHGNGSACIQTSFSDCRRWLEAVWYPWDLRLPTEVRISVYVIAHAHLVKNSITRLVKVSIVLSLYSELKSEVISM